MRACSAVSMVLAVIATAACADDDGTPDTNNAAVARADGPPDAVRVAPVVPETRTFRDWVAVCDNGLDCAAFTGAGNGWIKIAMAAGPDARPVVTLGGLTGDDSPDVALRVDGRDIPTQGQGLVSRVADDQTVVAVSALGQARGIELVLDGQPVTLPPAGASAALLWIDEKQGRLDTPNALRRRGERDLRAVPPAPDLPRVIAAPPVAQGPLAGADDPSEQGGQAGVRLPNSLETIPEVRECRAETAYNPNLQASILAGRLSAFRELWGVPCGAGAYNVTYVFYLTGPGGSDPVKADFPTWDNRERQEGDIAGGGLVNPVFDPRTNSVRQFPRARGIGDCGTIQSWSWTGQGFAPTSERTMGECWGMPADQWPTTWRTR